MYIHWTCIKNDVQTLIIPLNGNICINNIGV